MRRYRVTFTQGATRGADTILAATRLEAQRILETRKWLSGQHVTDVQVEDLGEVQPQQRR